MRTTGLRVLPADPWAKIRQEGDGRIYWHSLISHSADAGAVAEVLLDNDVLHRRLAHLANQTMLDDITVAKLCALIALHDFGKLSHGFQQQVLREPRVHLRGHCAPVLGAFNARRLSTSFPQALQIQELARCLGGGDIAVVIQYIYALMAHHGAPIPEESIHTAGNQCDPCWLADGRCDPLAELSRLIETVRAWYPLFGEPGSLPVEPAFIHAFTGLVTLADWIASDETLFPFDHPASSTDATPKATACDDEDATNRIAWARQHAASVVEGIGLSGKVLRTYLQSRSLRFEEIFPFSPNPVQRAMEQLDAVAPGTVTVLESETGSGKTEAALRHFLGLHRAGAVDGLYFALPLRSAAVQIANRLRADLARIAPSLAGRLPVITAVPGYTIPTSGSHIDMQDKLHSLPVTAFDWPDEGDDVPSHLAATAAPTIVRPDWATDHPKRFLAATIAVGTIDQALLGVLRVRHAHLRASSHLRHLLVVDEVHASDAYMTALLTRLVQRHRLAGGHVLLMSATLGAAARSTFVGESVVPDFAAAVSYPYPLISVSDQSQIPLDSGTSVHRKTITVQRCSTGDSPDVVADNIVPLVQAGARVLVIRNRVADAVETQRTLERYAIPTLSLDGIPTLHHSRFAREDRQRLDRAIEMALGRTGREAIVVVTTQTAEQSLDIDADVLVTDLAPADILLQRIGRLHRHPRQGRPIVCKHPLMILLTPPDDLFDMYIRQGQRFRARQGWGRVYPNFVSLQATLDAIVGTDRIVVPEDNRRLVECATHPEHLARVAAAHGVEWTKHLNEYSGQRLAQAGFARDAALEWTKDLLLQPFPRALEARLSTRLGDQDRAVMFDPHVCGAFGKEISQLVIPAWMCKSVPSGASVQNIVTSGKGDLRFVFGAQQFVYDRFGVRHATDCEDGQGAAE